MKIFKKVLSLVLALVIIVAAVPLGAFEFKTEAASTTTAVTDVWDGTKVQPVKMDSYGNILITTAEELAWIALEGGEATQGKNYKVADGVKYFDMSGMVGITINSSASQVSYASKTGPEWRMSQDGYTLAFRGNFDGNGVTVYNMATSRPTSTGYGGLFPSTQAGQYGSVTIKNVTVAASNFAAYHYSGGIIGYANCQSTSTNLSVQNCVVKNCYINDGGVTNNACRRTAATIVGCATHNTTRISNCFASGNVLSAANIVGGLLGNTSVYSRGVYIKNSMVIGSSPIPVDYLTTDNDSLNPPTKYATYSNVYTDRNISRTGITTLSNSQMKGARAKVNMSGLQWGVDWFVGSTGQYPTPIRPRYYTATSSSGSTTTTTTVPTIDVKSAINNIAPSSYAIKGFEVEVLGNKFSLLDFEAQVSLKLTDNIKITVDDNKNIKVLLGFDEGASANIKGANKSDTYWSDSYKEVKSMYQQLTGQKVDTTKLWNDFSKMRGKLKKIKANMVVGVDTTIAGYIEYKYTSSGYQFSEGGVLVGFDANAELSWGSVAFVTLGIGGGANGSLTFTNVNNKLNTALTVSPYLSLTLGVGLGINGPGWADFYGKVEGTGTLQAIISTNSSKPFSAGAYLSARAYGQLLMGRITFWEKDFDGIELYPSFGNKWSAKTLSMSTPDISSADRYNDLINSAVPVNRDYLTATYSLRRSSTYTNASFVKENLYPQNSARIVKFDNDNLLLVWVDDLGTKTTNNMGTLMYSYFDGAQWSEPEIVYEDGTHSDSPSVYSDGETAYIVWQKANTVVGDDVELSYAIKEYDLYATTFDNANKTFSEVICVNDYEDTVFEFVPQIYGSNGEYTITWAENSDNNVFLTSGENKLCFATFDQANNLVDSDTIITTTNSISSVINEDNKVYYSMFENDVNNLYCYDYQSTTFITSNVGAFNCENGRLFYFASDEFYSFDGVNTTKYSNISSLDNFVIVSSGTDYALFTTVLNEDFSKTLYYSKLTSSASDWTDLEVYSQKGKYIRNFAPVMLSDGNVQVAFNYYDEDTERAALVVENCTNDVDVAVTYVDFDESQIGNDTIDFEIGLKNNNSLAIDSFTVEISDSTGVLSTQTVEESLSAFEEKQISVNFDLPENYVSEKYSIKVMPNEYTELNEENNIVETTIECVHVVEWIITTEPTETADGVETYRCTKCGESYEERVLPRLKFAGASVTLQDDLCINYKVDKSLFEETGYIEPYVVFEFNGKEYRKDTYKIVGDYYVFTFNNIAPNKINDNIKSTLYAVYGDAEYIVSGRDYSVSTYCYNMLAKCTDDVYAEFRTLLIDLLNYGAQSQVYTNYNTENLANAQLTDTQKAWGTQENPTLSTVQKLDYETVENPTVKWYGGGLTLEDSVTMRFTIETESVENLVVKVVTADKTYTIKASAFKSIGNNRYYVYFNGLNASQMSEEVYVTVYNGEEAVSNTLRYSIESYAYAKQGGSDTKLSDLVIAMMKYGNAAYNYVN